MGGFLLTNRSSKEPDIDVALILETTKFCFYHGGTPGLVTTFVRTIIFSISPFSRIRQASSRRSAANARGLLHVSFLWLGCLRDPVRPREIITWVISLVRTGSRSRRIWDMAEKFEGYINALSDGTLPRRKKKFTRCGDIDPVMLAQGS